MTNKPHSFLLYKLIFIMTTKTPKNHGKKWTKEDIALLKKLAKENTPTRVIWLDQNLWRTESSIFAKAQEKWISLQPTNQSPYWTKK